VTLAVILASASTARRALLAGAGIAAEAIKPDIDEHSARAAMREASVSVGDQAMHLAELKALRISRQHPGLVIGGDQMLNLDGSALDKPATMAEAAEHLRRLSGQSHRLETAIVIAENGQLKTDRPYTERKFYSRLYSALRRATSGYGWGVSARRHRRTTLYTDRR